MGGFNVLSLIIPISVISICCSTLSSSSASSIYDVLRSHGLPIGLLPKGVTNFTVEPYTGHFEVRLQAACNAQFETQVHYDFNVSGTLGYGRIGDLSGMLAQELFLWFPVKGILVDNSDSSLIYFDVGVVRKQFPQSVFEIPRECTASRSRGNARQRIPILLLLNCCGSKMRVEFLRIDLEGLSKDSIRKLFSWQFHETPPRQIDEQI